jgi:cytoskeletal protein RodZ
MDLPSPNQNETKPIIPEMNGPMPPQQHTAPGAQWLRLGVLVVVGLLVLALLFLGGRWTYRKIAHHSTKPTTATTGSKSSTPSKKPSSSQGSSSAPSSGSSSTPAPASNSSTTPSNGSQSGGQAGSGTQVAANGKLTNTGPGSTAALFTIATATGVIAYQVVLRRRTE